MPLWSATAIVTLKQGQAILSLVYILWDQVRTQASPEDWPFSRENKHWLYDEIDSAGTGTRFRHRILFSDGVVVEIPFLTVITSRVSLPVASDNANSKRTA